MTDVTIAEQTKPTLRKKNHINNSRNNEKFGADDIVNLNGCIYRRCEFGDCEMVGGRDVRFEECTFKGRSVKWLIAAMGRSIVQVVGKGRSDD